MASEKPWAACGGTEPTNPDLQKERNSAIFDVEALTNILDGGPELTRRRRETVQLALDDPNLTGGPDYRFLSREEKYTDGLRRSYHFIKKIQDEGLINETEITWLIGAVWPNEAAPIAVHLSMFLPGLMGQASDEQMMEWMPRALSFEVVGTYAQTELGHGTHVRGLETTATYDPKTEEFVINSPTRTSLKWWPGGLGKTTNHVILVAQLWSQGKNYGPHSFLVQTRQMGTHQPLPGITIGDIGPKFGYNTIDNGFLGFDHVRIPRKNMMTKNYEILKDGTFKQKKKSDKLSYGTMVFVRAMIISNVCVKGLAQACMIALRYSAVRRQSELKPRAPEPQILDFVTQQYKLFPLLATCYAYHFAGKHISSVYKEVNDDIQRGNVESLPELHALSSCLKSFTTAGAMVGIEQCRLACGGLGYSDASGLPKIYVDTVSSCTYEGENTVLYLQAARYIIKAQQQVEAGHKLTGFTAYLEQPNSAPCSINKNANFNDILSAYKHRSARLIRAVNRKLQNLISQGMPQYEAWNVCSVELVRAAEAHTHYFIVQNFKDNIVTLKNWSIRHLLTQLWQLYALQGIYQNSGDFLAGGYMSDQQLEMVTDKMLNLLPSIRPNAVALCDAFDFTDRHHGSILGRYDGNVYENVYKWAQNSPLNKTQVHESFYKYLQPLQKKWATSKL